MNTLNFPASQVSTKVVGGEAVFCVVAYDKPLYSWNAPEKMNDGTLMFRDCWMLSENAAAIKSRLEKLPKLGKSARRQEWQAIAADFGVDYKFVMGVNGGGGRKSDLI